MAQKEKDLELAARIGQQLVGRNKALEERQNTLEAELSAATDTNTQLQHQLTLKANLLSIYTDDVEDSSCDGQSISDMRAHKLNDIVELSMKFTCNPCNEHCSSRVCIFPA